MSIIPAPWRGSSIHHLVSVGTAEEEEEPVVEMLGNEDIAEQDDVTCKVSNTDSESDSGVEEELSSVSSHNPGESQPW